jgi:hypothetical protein
VLIVCFLFFFFFFFFCGGQLCAWVVKGQCVREKKGEYANVKRGEFGGEENEAFVLNVKSAESERGGIVWAVKMGYAGGETGGG